MNITITDTSNNMTVIGAGARVRFRKIKSAVQITGWKEGNGVFQGGGSIIAKPFAVGGGDCLFDTGSLFCFAGPRNRDSDNVLMVLWDFPLHPKLGDSGQGQLNAPPAAGLLVDGSIDWEIVLV